MQPADLQAFLEPLDGLTDDDAFARGREIYDQLYTQGRGRGELAGFQERRFVFHADRYDHAFRTSPDLSRRAYSKQKVARTRIERIRWIKELLGGTVEGTECWHVPNDAREWQPEKNIVVHRQLGYLIWLNITKQGQWRFSSAYPATAQAINGYLQPSRLVWRA